MLIYIYLAVSAVISVAVSVFSGLADSWGDIWIVLLLFLAAFLAIVIIHLALIAIVSLCIRKKEPRPESLIRKFAIVSLELLISLARVRVHVRGEEKLPRGTFVMVCNHRSLVDPVAALVALRRYNLAFISKKENVSVPVFGKYIVSLGCLYLDRENVRAAMTTINTAAEQVKSGKWSMAICPEGTRNRTDEALLPFHAGSFKIAQKAKSPLVIAVFKGTELVKHNAVKRRTDVYIDILDVLPPERVSAMKTAEMAEYAREIMLADLEGDAK